MVMLVMKEETLVMFSRVSCDEKKGCRSNADGEAENAKATT